MYLTLITPPTVYPVNISELKMFCRVEDTDNDSILTSFLKSAVEVAENETGRRFISQSWRLDLAQFSDEIRLPYPPIISVDSIQYYDTNNTLQTLAAADYDVAGVGSVGIITQSATGSYPAVYSRPDAIQVNFTCGYGGPTEIPESLKNAINTIAWFLFDGRGDQLDQSFIDVLLGQHVMRGFIE